MLAPTASERLLDVGTGPGLLLTALARRHQRPADATGIDSSPEMLARASVLPAGWSLDEADATALPFDEKSFDVVTASYFFHVVEARERGAAIAEIARVLRPGGRLGTITIAPPKSPLTRALAAPISRITASSGERLRGLRQLDPMPELLAQGFLEAARRTSLRGYPSLCIVASKPRGA